MTTMDAQVYKKRIAILTSNIQESGLDVLLLTKPSNMFYLTGDGRLCAYTLITKDGQVALGVPITDIVDVKALAYHDLIVGFDDEGGMRHSIDHHFTDFGLSE